MAPEPRLRPEDEAAWARWQIVADRHARTPRHRARVDASRRLIEEALARPGTAAVMWSGGKDSTAMTHLIGVEIGRSDVPVYSEKDDLDFPGEREYVAELARGWGLDLRILTPTISPLEWVKAHRAEMVAGGDLHSRAAGLSKACFYGVVEQATANCGTIFLGLRAEESRGRRMNRAVRGPTYQKARGQWMCSPIVDWSGVDVMAYCAARGIPLLPLYRCIAFANARDPWQVRKSWWLPGHAANMGSMAWLRHYYPSLYAQATGLVEGANRLS